MKKLIALLFSAFLVNALFGTVFVTESEFNTAFADMEFYAEIRSGGTLGEDSHEFEIGTPLGTVNFKGNTIWSNNSENPFIVKVDTENNLSVSVNGDQILDNQVTPEEVEATFSNPFNEIWIGLKIQNIEFGAPSVANHQYDGSSVNSLSVNSSSILWSGFKIVDDLELGNIANFTIEGDLIPGMDLGSASSSEGWTYTIFGKFNPEIVPEPETYSLLFGLTALVAVMIRRR